MKLALKRSIQFLACVLICAAVRPAIGEDNNSPRSTSFKVKITADQQLTIQGKPLKLNAESEFGYAWSVKGNERTLSYDFMNFKSTTDTGQADYAMIQSRERFMMDKKGGKHVDVDFEHAPPEVQQRLRCFGEPLCVLTVDENGRELSRKEVASPVAKSTLVAYGAITNATLFHVAYFPDKHDWRVPIKFSSGGETDTVDGDLTLTKIADEGGLPTFKVDGTLVKDEQKSAGSAESLRAIRYAITGSQRYDSARKEWVAGTWNIDTAYQMYHNDQQYGSNKGTMKVELERVTAKGDTRP